MPPPLATVYELSERLGVDLQSEGAEYARAAAALQDASALIRAEAGVDWLDADDPTQLAADVPAIVVSICLAAAYRTYRNPDGAVQSSVGDVSVSFGRDAGGGAGVYLTDSERRAIRKAAGHSGASSVALVSPWMDGSASAYYVEVEGGGDYFPLGPFPWEV